MTHEFDAFLCKGCFREWSLVLTRSVAWGLELGLKIWAKGAWGAKQTVKWKTDLNGIYGRNFVRFEYEICVLLHVFMTYGKVGLDLELVFSVCLGTPRRMRVVLRVTPLVNLRFPPIVPRLITTIWMNSKARRTETAKWAKGYFMRLMSARVSDLYFSNGRTEGYLKICFVRVAPLLMAGCYPGLSAFSGSLLCGV